MRNWIVADYTFYHWMEKDTPKNVSVRPSQPDVTPDAINLDAYGLIVAIPLRKGRDDNFIEGVVYGIPAGVDWQGLSPVDLRGKGCHALINYRVLETTDYDHTIGGDVIVSLFRYAQSDTQRERIFP